MRDEAKSKRQLIKEKEFVEALRQVGIALNSTLDYTEILDRILEQLGRVVPHDTTSIMLIESNIVRDFRWRGYEQFGREEQIASAMFDIDDTPNLRKMQETGQPLVISYTEDYDGWKPRSGGGWSKSYIGSPIRIRNQVIGFLNVDSTTPGFFSQTDAENLLTFADQAAIAIENARLYSQALQEVMERQRVEEALRQYQEHLEELVAERTAELTQINDQLRMEIAERKRIEETLRQYTTELQARNEELDTFAHTVAHDLKNPIGVMTGMAEILTTDHPTLPPESLSEYLQAIAQSGHKANAIIDELLLLAGLRQQEVKKTALNMAEIVAEVQQRLKYMIEEYQASLVLPATWPTVLGYGPWVEEVWANYLSNAMKYGGRPPHLELGATYQPKEMVHFWVRDNGPGLTPEEQAKLFEPFTRLHTQIKGHGLGLSIVRRIIEKLGGQVGVESAGVPGQGSLFYFSLPAFEEI